MAVIKCKMCGGDLILTEGSNVAECEYCGTRQTVPSADNEKKLSLFARANRLRARSEFDTAAGVYESIVADFPEEAEAYWGLILCKYGIEYVDDPVTGKKIPTCHRSSFDSLMDDPNFELVMENADPVARRVYRDEARQIEELRKGIIEVSNKEEPYDIFICYKETDEKGDRTLDSVLAQDVYDMLTENGYRVFFSRVSLEDKLGVEYEPYIFAALNSAKIMLAFGTDYDYFNAVWVKNEWSRFLQLIAKGEKKTLIPCYKGIDAYDMPKEFAKLQAQDLGKLGANQDLLRGIKKILPKTVERSYAGTEAASSHRTTSSVTASINNLLRRGFIFLEEQSWESATAYFNRVLDADAENAAAYLGLAMAAAKQTDQNCFGEAYIAGEIEETAAIRRAKQYANAKQDQWWSQLEARRKAEIDKKEAIQKAREAQLRKAATQIIAAIWEKTNGRVEITKQKIAAEQKKVEEMERICAGYDGNEEQIKETETEINTIQARINQINGRLPSLGLFSFNEKISLKEELETLERRLKNANGTRNLLISRRMGYQTKNAAVRVCEKQKRYLAYLEKSEAILQEYDPNICSFEQAMDIYHRGGPLWETVCALDPAITVRLAAGRTIPVACFGQYQESPGVYKPIEWLILEKYNGLALLISKYALDSVKFNDVLKPVTWQSSAVRRWLNTTFLENAFSPDERRFILNAEIRAESNPRHSTYAGQPTEDRVFLLNIQEAGKFFPSKEARRCKGTPYCYAQGAHCPPSGFAWWWLRSPGSRATTAVTVDDDGEIMYNGDNVNNNFMAIRPAILFNLEA